MGNQYKLFKIYEYEKTRQELVNLFNVNNLWNIDSSLIGISYDYCMNQYRDLLNKSYNLNVSQKIITSRTFVEIIKKCIDKGYFIRKIEFIESIPEDVTECIKENIEKLNSSKSIEEKSILKKSIANELNWLIRNDGIDIKCISIRVKDNDNLRVGVSIYNNGVVSVDNTNILDSVAELLK